MKSSLRILVLAVLFITAADASASFTASGTFQYEDRIWDKDGYTGAAQNLPIRFADVEIVRSSNSSVVGTGSTDANGDFSVFVSAGGSFDVFARVLSSTDNSADYHITVSTNNGGSGVHAVPTTAMTGSNSIDPDFGTWLIQDTDGTGVAQAFNILDRTVDGMDWLAQPQVLNRLPNAGEFLNYRWSPSGTIGGSFYTGQQINIAQPGSGDTDGWADAVILHEMGHYVADVFHQDDNTGGSHFIGDNFQDPRLSYGEGYATYFCAEVREFVGLPTDDKVSIYADVAIPPAVGIQGGLEFSYDFETGLFGNGTPIGQFGQANETNITSAMWDLTDGPGTNDESPGVDDDLIDGDGGDVWAVLLGYMESLPGAEVITFEDFVQGWSSVHGPAYQAAEFDDILNNLNNMGFFADAFEPDDTSAQATVLPVPTYGPLLGLGGVVINEVELGGEDGIELYNSSLVAVDITGWQFEATTNTSAQESNLFYTFPSYVLPPGGFVWVRERGDAANNSAVDLYGGSFSIPWFNGGAGSITLSDAGSTPVDFVRWDGVGDPSITPVPAGLTFTGNVLSPAGGMTLARNSAGTDTNDASDFAEDVNTSSQPNRIAFADHTIFDTGDVDVVRVSLVQGKLYTLRTFRLIGAADTFMEVLKPDGSTVLATNDDRANLILDSGVTFVAPTTDDYFVRTSHVGQLTTYGQYSLVAYEHPDADLQLAPLSVQGVSFNASPTDDPVFINWLNGSLYDNVQVDITGPGAKSETLNGDKTQLFTTLPTGVHNIAVTGERGGNSTASATGWVYAGPVPTAYSNSIADLADFGADAPWATTTAISNSGPTSVTDSPSGNYGDNIDVSLELRVPVLIGASGTLSFQHICLTEAFYDFGYVQVTADDGLTWDTLGVFDQTDGPGWGDGIANAGDWVNESLSLAAYAGQRIRVRFRLISDAFVTEDGWYIDDILITSNTVVGVPEAAPVVFALDQNLPNPFNPMTTIRYSVPHKGNVELRVFDVRGRMVRTLVSGFQDAGVHSVTWNGTDAGGARVSSGVYFYRMNAGSFEQTRKLVLVE